MSNILIIRNHSSETGGIRRAAAPHDPQPAVVLTMGYRRPPMPPPPSGGAVASPAVRSAWRPRLAERLSTTHYAEWIGLAAALIPILVAVLRAATTSWRPEYDAAYFAARSLDVFTSRQPLVGGWSAFSDVAGESIHHPGPLQFLALAPFTRLDPVIGTAVGVGVVNAAAVGAVWFCGRRLFGPRGVLAAMAATVVLEVSLGGLALVDARQQLALLLPLWAVLWLTTAVANGHGRFIGPWVVALALVFQTHLSYVYLALTMAVAGGAMFVACGQSHRRVRSARRSIIVGAALVLVLFALPLWDQLAGTANLGRVAAHAAGANPVGVTGAARILATGSFSFPFWLPSHLGTFDAGHLASAGIGWVVALVWLGALTGTTIGSTRRSGSVDPLAIVALSAFVAGLLTAARSPSGAFAALPQTYLWLWPLSLFGAFTIAREAARLLPPLDHQIRVLAAGVAPLTLFALPANLSFTRWQLPPEMSGVAGRSLLEEIGTNLDALDVELGAAVVVEPVQLRVFAIDYYNIIGELTRRGIDVHFPRDDVDRQRFGADRCEQPDDRWRLRIVIGSFRPEPEPADRVLADRRGPDQTSARRLQELRDQVAAELAEGSFRVDIERLDEAGTAGESLAAMLSGPDRPVAGGDLFFAVPGVVDRGLATVRAGFEDTYDHWLDAERGATASNVLVYLVPNYFPVESPCVST